MTAALLMKWAEIGAILINDLGVPILSVIRLFRAAGGTEEELVELIGKWAALITNLKARIVFLKAATAVLADATK